MNNGTGFGVVVYVARDLERVLGLPINTPNYYIISNYSSFGKRVAGVRKNVLLIKSNRILDTRELLGSPRAKRFIKLIKNPQILVFKPTTVIEKICTDNNWTLLNPPAKLAAQVEEKISQVEWLGSLAKKLLPPFGIKECGKIKWAGKKFILQFNFAHTGQGTILVESEKQLNEIKKKFPLRPARVTKFILGPMFTNNNVVWGKKVLVGNINYQITGLKPFTNNPFATIGNDWALPHKILTSAQKKEYEKMAQVVGKRLVESGWKGLFGIDVIVEEKTGKLYLIEINARQPASTTYESQLQTLACHPCESGDPVVCHCEPQAKQSLTTFAAHLLALSGAKYTGQKLIKIKTGAQVVQKVVTNNMVLQSGIINKLQKLGIESVSYENYEAERDWLRLQVKGSLCSSAGQLNNLGNKIAELLAIK